MESKRYIISILILITIIFSTHRSLAQTVSNQSVSFGFFETYTWTEILSDLDQSDSFFKWLNTEGEDEDGCRLGSCQKANAAELWKHIHNDAFRSELPEDIRFAWGSGKDENLVLYALKQPDGSLKGPDKSQIQEVSVNQSAHGDSYELFIAFTDKGAKQWAEFTSANVNRSIAIVFNDQVYSAPMVVEAIKHGKCSISGSYSESDVNHLKSLLQK